MNPWPRIVLLVAMAVCSAFAPKAFAAGACPLTLEWQPSPDEGVAGYALYYGPSDEPITNRVDVGLDTLVVLKDLMAGREYSFYVVAYDVDQAEGAPSSPLVYTPSAISPLKLCQLAEGSVSISFHVAPNAVCWVEYTDTLAPANWILLTMTAGDSDGTVIISDAAPTPGTSRFYRAVVSNQ